MFKFEKKYKTKKNHRIYEERYIRVKLFKTSNKEKICKAVGDDTFVKK